MQFSHEKHYYFFEKYLRNEMNANERELFEQKLQEDAEYLQSFENYKANREEIVKEELKEYEVEEILPRKPEKWGWVYTSISLLCIVLMVDYYISSSYDNNPQTHEKRKPLIDKINIFKSSSSGSSKNGTAHSNERTAPAEPADTLSGEALLFPERDSLEPWQDYIEVDRMGIQGDYFVCDSMFRMLDAEHILEKTQKPVAGADSLERDTVVSLANIQGYLKTSDESGSSLLVEFWDSPIHFNGYLFNGKKLLIYGVEPNLPIYLLHSANGKYYHIFIRDKEFQLFADQQFHKLAEE